MRTTKEIMALLLDIAEKDERIRCLYLNGSRSNPNVKKDIFQDYDVVYVVMDTQPFIDDVHWIDIFGERLYMQMPEAMDKALHKVHGHACTYGWLMQLKDGNRIDLHVQSIPYAKQVITEDSLCIVYMDKDQILPTLATSSDRKYWIKRPSLTEFQCCCNEFWWLQNNIAKGLWREEITSVMDMQNHYVRPQLLTLLSWYSGSLHGFNFSIGKNAKYLVNYLPEQLWQDYLQTFTIANVDALWKSSFLLCELFDALARKLSITFSYPYDTEEALHSLSFLQHVHQLPQDATEIY